MTEFKHTPGPWVQATRGPNGCPIIGTENGLMVAMLAHSSNENHQRQEAEANACMIAAAPVLLEALQAALSQCLAWQGEPNEHSCEIHSEIVRQARAAIAKATGGQE